MWKVEKEQKYNHIFQGFQPQVNLGQTWQKKVDQKVKTKSSASRVNVTILSRVRANHVQSNKSEKVMYS